MGSISGIDDFVFPPGQTFQFGSLDFITNDFCKISLLGSDPNQPRGDEVSVPFGLPNSAEIYSKIISSDSASNHSDEIPSTLTRPDQDDGAYPSILMKLPDDLAAVFTTRMFSSCRSRRDPASAPIQSSSREVGVILQPLRTVSTEELDGYLSSPGVDSRPMEILEYDDFGYHYDFSNLDNFDKGHEDNYTPLFLGGTFERPGTQFDLYNVIQKPGESLRDYIRRFSEQRNKISDITNDVIIAAFTKCIRHELLVGKFGCKPPKAVKQMFEKANEYAKAEDARSRINTLDKIMNAQCSHHPNLNHAAKDCFIYQQFAEQYAKKARKPTDEDQSTSKKKDDEDDAPTGFQDSRKELNHIFGGPLAYESKRKQKLTEREINAIQPDTPQYLRWSETAIKFDRLDHPDRVVHPGRYPLETRAKRTKTGGLVYRGVEGDEALVLVDAAAGLQDADLVEMSVGNLVSWCSAAGHQRSDQRHRFDQTGGDTVVRPAAVIGAKGDFLANNTGQIKGICAVRLADLLQSDRSTSDSRVTFNSAKSFGFGVLQPFTPLWLAAEAASADEESGDRRRWRQ
uniref:OSJNBa0027H06.4 protein n=1 Tax=Oryza sativa subsp. japonica TaxID=39947 RepID=Q7X733_ORYSJ|nr:OSJNBa0027H06.4 [Oryza sativa Japonica Group]